MEWFSVKDIFPKEDGYYLVSHTLDNGERIVSLRYFYHNCIEAFIIKSITHWMPLPELPE